MLIVFIKESNQFEGGQFDIRKWVTNDIKLKNKIQINESLESSDTLPLTNDLTIRKVLGVYCRPLNLEN